MQLDGKRFFYVNPLAVDTRVAGIAPGYEHVQPQRPPWHTCACCPPNLARFIVSLGKYLWSEDGDTVYSHLLIGSEAATRFGRIRLESRLPWTGEARYTVLDGGAFTLAIHLPAYAANPELEVNGRLAAFETRRGYCHIRRLWLAGDTAVLRFDLPVRRVYADPRVRDCAGRVALVRGPIVYCFEQVDQEAPVFSLQLPRGAGISLTLPPDHLPEALVCLRMEGLSDKPTDGLYSLRPPKSEPCVITAIPYFAWGNRAKGDMTVWIRESPGP